MMRASGRHLPLLDDEINHPSHTTSLSLSLVQQDKANVTSAHPCFPVMQHWLKSVVKS